MADVRILIVDDEAGMHESYRQCFAKRSGDGGSALNAMAAELFGDEDPISGARLLAAGILGQLAGNGGAAGEIGMGNEKGALLLAGRRLHDRDEGGNHLVE